MSTGGDRTGTPFADPPRNPRPRPPAPCPRLGPAHVHVADVVPDGFGTPMQLDGCCRDIRTTATGAVDLLGEAEVHVRAAADRTIEAIEAQPPVPGVERLVGARGGSDLRAAIDAAVPDERRNGAPLHLLRDLRTVVLETLRSTDCCTHLNDALRALAEVPILAGHIEGASIST